MQSSRFNVRMLRPAIVALFILHLALLAGACAKARAESAPDGPPLQIPFPPEHVLVPVEPPVETASAPEPEPVPPPAATVPRTPAARPATPAKPQPTPPVAVAPAAPSPPAESRELTAPSPASGANERSVRDLLTRASRDLSRVDYSRLSTDSRAQYEQSKRFSEQAEQALKEKNLIFAATLADKAATLAAELLGK
jgi:type IV secretory pathway VirB10-like protein